MKRYIDAEKLKAEIERYENTAIDAYNPKGEDADFWHGKVVACEDIKTLIASLQQEQPERTCKTCGFYENNCPFIRGKFTPYPNKVCKDYTYSAMKEQSHFADADKMEQSEGNNHINLPERIFLWEDEMKEFLAGKRKTVQIGINQDLVRGLLTYIRYDVAQEVVQPEIDLEKEIDEYFSRWMQGASDEGCYNADSQLVSIYDCHRIARHFAEWGAIHLNARKEE